MTNIVCCASNDKWHNCCSLYCNIMQARYTYQGIFVEFLKNVKRLILYNRFDLAGYPHSKQR